MQSKFNKLSFLVSLTCGAVISSGIIASAQQAAPEKKEAIAIPKDLIADPELRAQLGINEFTAPSIRLIFDDLDQLTPLPVKETKHVLPNRLPLNRASMAIEIGFIIADGFLAVQHGHLDEIEPLAQELSRYGESLGAGERVNRHAKIILDSAKKKDLEKLKDELAATQKDVEKELVQLHDADLAHLISLGGWVRAMECAAVGVSKEFTEERANQLFREDIAEYYESQLGALDPRISQLPNIVEMRKICSGLKIIMTLGADEEPTEAKVMEITEQSKKLAVLALSRK